MEAMTTHNSLLSSPLSSPNVAALLQIKILSWTQETGFPVCIRVRVADRTFNLHKHPLISKSGYLRDKLQDSNDVELPPDFPGGPHTFEAIALFIYGSSTFVDPFNVASLRCGAEFLGMTEEYFIGNLCQRFDIYLNQVVLQCWDHTLIVLRQCLILLPWAEDLLIVGRCIETLAFMACMEILDPEKRRDHPVVTLEALARRPWTGETVKDIIRVDSWIKDLVTLPFEFFKRVVRSLKRQGMKERYVSPIILFYADEWVLQNENIKDNTGVVLQGVIDLLPKASKVIPVGLYFSLLSKSFELGSRNDCVDKLQSQIASVLHLAQVGDFVSPKGGIGSSVMETIFSTYYNMSCNYMESDIVRNNDHVVAELWDLYLNQIAVDLELGCKRFMELIEIVPISSRQTNDHLYRAITTFFQLHPNLSQEEKASICKILDCQKLSEEACIEAVQNEMMPVRLIVQALLVQQLNTRQVIKECSDSFRYTHCGGEYSGSLSSSKDENSKSRNLDDSPYVNGSENVTRSLSVLPQRDSSIRSVQGMSSCISNKDYESTSFRGTASFGTQRKCVHRILKVLQRMSLFGRGRSKRKADTSNMSVCNTIDLDI